jgi:hypothetical protein
MSHVPFYYYHCIIIMPPRDDYACLLLRPNGCAWCLFSDRSLLSAGIL